MGKLALFAALFALFCLAFADVGPSPAPPSITVNFIKGGAPYTGNVQLAYNCTFQNDGDASSPVGQRVVNFACNGGTCTNGGGWFYKFNPCFYPPEGRFQYALDGVSGYGSTGNMAFNESLLYKVEVDLDGGSVKKTTTRPGLCPLAFVTFAGALACAGIFKRGVRI